MYDYKGQLSCFARNVGGKLTSSGKIVFFTELPEINSVVAMTMLKKKITDTSLFCLIK